MAYIACNAPAPFRKGYIFMFFSEQKNNYNYNKIKFSKKILIELLEQFFVYKDLKKETKPDIFPEGIHSFSKTC